MTDYWIKRYEVRENPFGWAIVVVDSKGFVEKLRADFPISKAS